MDIISRDLDDKNKRGRHRKIEMTRMQGSLKELDGKKGVLEAQKIIYMDYLESCLANQVSAKRKRRLTITLTGSVKKEETSFSDPATFTADKLFAKGVIVELRDVPENQ